MINFGLNSASVLAQVNFGANSASILGIFLAVAGAALYFLRSVRPELSRDQDIFCSSWFIMWFYSRLPRMATRPDFTIRSTTFGRFYGIFCGRKYSST